MTITSSCHLLDMLLEVPDLRDKKGQHHLLPSMLALTVVGSCVDNAAIHRLPNRHASTPTCDTLWGLLRNKCPPHQHSIISFGDLTSPL